MWFTAAHTHTYRSKKGSVVLSMGRRTGCSYNMYIYMCGSTFIRIRWKETERHFRVISGRAAIYTYARKIGISNSFRTWFSKLFGLSSPLVYFFSISFFLFIYYYFFFYTFSREMFVNNIGRSVNYVSNILEP